MSAADDYPQLAMWADADRIRPTVTGREARLALDEIDTFREYRRLVAERAARADAAVTCDPLAQAERRACLAELDDLIAEAIAAHGDT